MAVSVVSVVSVESGVGWIPFVLEGLRYEMVENAPRDLARLPLTPMEYFQRQMYATTWFEHADLAYVVDRVGADRILFESDFPHPTCLYPDPLAVADELPLAERDAAWSMTDWCPNRCKSRWDHLKNAAIPGARWRESAQIGARNFRKIAALKFWKRVLQPMSFISSTAFLHLMTACRKLHAVPPTF